jgi:hypothetical protein
VCLSSLKGALARCWWFTPIILATQEAESRRIVVQPQPEQILFETVFQKHPTQKRTVGIAQCVGLELKPQY